MASATCTTHAQAQVVRVGSAPHERHMLSCRKHFTCTSLLPSVTPHSTQTTPTAVLVLHHTIATVLCTVAQHSHHPFSKRLTSSVHFDLYHNTITSLGLPSVTLPSPPLPLHSSQLVSSAAVSSAVPVVFVPTRSVRCSPSSETLLCQSVPKCPSPHTPPPPLPLSLVPAALLPRRPHRTT